RFTGLVITAPIFGSRDIPPQVRGLLAFALALIVTPLQWGTPIAYPGNLINYATFIGCEILIGAILGLGIMILFQGLQVTGRLIAKVSGMALADSFDPAFNDSVPVPAQLLTYITMGVFVLLGGVEQLVAALLDSYENIPAGAAGVPAGLVAVFTVLLSSSFD